MESPDAAPPSHPDALDALELRALGLLRDGDTSGWEALLDAIERAEQTAGAGGPTLYRQPPPIDPSEGRRSSAELRRLVEAVQVAEAAQGAPPEPPPPRSRAGYSLEGSPLLGDTRVLPAFVAALGSAASLREGFPDLWAIDAALWARLDSAGVRELAALWLESPGRRLVQDLGVLDRMPRAQPLGASDLSPARIDAAAGLVGNSVHEERPSPLSRRHHELHCAVPGLMLDSWEPSPVRSVADQVLRALHLLEEGSPLGLRGAALAWLLDRAADDPIYTVEGLRRDLRDDLPIRLSTALAGWLGDAGASAVPRQLESLALQHAARLLGPDASAEATRRGWALARWLQGCLRRSPFFGADEEVLAAHLQARLAAPAVVPEDADALHPARFSPDDTGLDVAEIAFLAGVLAHYQRAQEHTLLPTPVPLVHALQRIAKRRVRPAEEEADAALAAGHNALGWPEGYPIAPPLAARRLMTDLRIGWVAQVDEEAQLDSLERFARDPIHNAWVAFALLREGQQLGSSARARAVDIFRALAGAGLGEAHVIGTFGTGLLEGLTDRDADRILDLAASADALWRPFVVDALAGAAERSDRSAIWTRTIERLLTLMEDGHLDDKARLNAALFALRRASASKLPNRDALLGRIAATASAPPFSDHLGLRREIRRLGLPTPAAAGSKR